MHDDGDAACYTKSVELCFQCAAGGGSIGRVDGDPVATGHVERTNPVIYAIAEGLEIGSDTGTPVWPGYESPFPFTGGIVEVVLGTAGAEHVDPAAEDRIARHVQ